MKRTCALTAWLALTLAPLAVSGFTGHVGEIAVIEDTTGEIHSYMAEMSRFCREAAKVFYRSHPDEVDTIIAFTTKELNLFTRTFQGWPGTRRLAPGK
jgi:hypothetical protein